MAFPQSEWAPGGSAGIPQNGTGASPCDLGGAVLRQIHQDVKVDPFDGTSREFTFRGYVLEVNAAQAAALANGWQARIETNGSQWPSLVVTIPNPGSSEYTDRWEFNTEFKQQDLWININVINYLQSQGLSLNDIVNAKANLQDSLNNNDSYDSVNNQYGAPLINIYQFMQMGGQYVEVAQPVISRKRTYDVNSYTGPSMVTRNTGTIYSTANLIGTFGIPLEVQNQIEADPVTLPVANFAYGWKTRKNNLEIIPAKNKVTENVDWVWDQWSTLVYNFAG